MSFSVVIRYVHKYNPSFRDVEGPFLASESDLVDLESVRRWFKKTFRGSKGRSAVKRGLAEGKRQS